MPYHTLLLHVDHERGGKCASRYQQRHSDVEPANEWNERRGRGHLVRDVEDEYTHAEKGGDAQADLLLALVVHGRRAEEADRGYECDDGGRRDQIHLN